MTTIDLCAGDLMRRREFIALVSGAAAPSLFWPLAAWAQQPRLARIGALVLASADAQSLGKELREGLRELGYVEGQNFVFEFRSADGNADRLPELAAELVRLQVDVITPAYTPLRAGGEAGDHDHSHRHGGRR